MTLRKVALLGVPYDASSSYQRGAAGAPTAVREALWSEARNTWTEAGIDLRQTALDDEGDLVFPDGEPSAAARARIEDAVGSILESGRRPLLLGGDHSITYPVLRGVRRHHQRLGILHLDAHSDLYEEFQGDRYSHACPFARIMEEGLADRLVQVGIRTMTGHQRDQAEHYGVEVLDMRTWRDGTPLRFEMPVYLSLDLDVLEPGLAPGVSHPEPGGLTVRQVLDIIHTLEAPLAGADVVELNPRNDPSGLTAAVAAKLVKEIAARMLTETR
ncbi:MAG TPA: agmatinase [Gemmatimonadales bacterium]|nr:agmatinase [Gemmatimonadales bacterium]